MPLRRDRQIARLVWWEFLYRTVWTSRPPPILHGQMSREEAEERAEDLYRALELPDPDRLGKRYPHQVSGGQLQRLMAAMALCGRPDLLVLDEPTTALDVTTQIEVLKAFKSVIKREGAAALYVTHDLSVVAQIADRIVVLYAGDILEHGDANQANQVINRPAHDYTRRLMAAVRPPPAAARGQYGGPGALRSSKPSGPSELKRNTQSRMICNPTPAKRPHPNDDGRQITASAR